MCDILSQQEQEQRGQSREHIKRLTRMRTKPSVQSRYMVQHVHTQLLLQHINTI